MPAFSTILEDHDSKKGVPAEIPPASVRSQSELWSWMLEWLGEEGDMERSVMIQGLDSLWLARNDAKDGRRIADPK